MEIGQVRTDEGHIIGPDAVYALTEQPVDTAYIVSQPPTDLHSGASDLAARILEPLKRHHGLVEIISLQGERWDGKGHHGTRGGAIPLGARILGAANLYVELTEMGHGGPAMSAADAVANLRGLAGTLLDPRVLDALEQVVLKS